MFGNTENLKSAARTLGYAFFAAMLTISCAPESTSGLQGSFNNNSYVSSNGEVSCANCGSGSHGVSGLDQYSVSTNEFQQPEVYYVDSFASNGHSCSSGGCGAGHGGSVSGGCGAGHGGSVSGGCGAGHGGSVSGGCGAHGGSVSGGCGAGHSNVSAGYAQPNTGLFGGPGLFGGGGLFGGFFRR